MLSLLVFLLALLSPTQLGKHLWPAYSYLQGLKIDYLSPTLYLTDLLLFTLLPFSFNQFRRWISQHLIFFLFLVFFILLNILFAFHPLPALLFWFRLFLLLNLFLLLVNRSKLLKPLYFGLLIAVLYTALLTFAQFLNQASLNGFFYFLGERHFTTATPGITRLNLAHTFPYSLLPFPSALLLRPYATFSHPNSLAGFLLVSLMLLFILNRHLNLKKSSLYLIFLPALPALFITFSRTVSLVALIILPLLFLSSRLPQLFKKTFLFLTLALSFLFTLLYLFPQAFSSLSSHSPWQDRLFLNHTAVQLFTQHPLFGTGLNNFLYGLSRLHPHTPYSLLQPAHHLFWLLLSQLGLPLLLPLLYYFLKFLFSLPFSYQLILLALLLTGLTDHYWLTLPQNRLLLTLSLTTLSALKDRAQ